MVDAVNLPSVQEACHKMFEDLSQNSKKAEMALELLYTSEPGEMSPPQYIAEGLKWLEERLLHRNADYILQEATEIKGAQNEQ